MKIQFSSREQASVFITDTALHDKFKIKVKLPKMLLQRSTVIYGIPIDMFLEVIIENSECIYPIIDLQRLKKEDSK